MISICIITKNEKEYLEECLKRLHNHPVEIIVVDTGSTDGTKEMVSHYTDKCFDFSWCDDFAAARNFAAKKATNDRIVAIDSDEWLVEADFEQIEHLVEENPKRIGRLKCVNSYTQQGKELQSIDWLKRIYDRRYAAFVGKVHEQIELLDGSNCHTFQADLIIDHRGYLIDANAKRKKTERNLSLLQLELSEHPQDTYLLYQIGKSYYFVEDYPHAVEYFCKALETEWNPKDGYTLDLCTCLGYALVNCGLAETALELEQYWDCYPENADYTYLMAYLYMQNRRFDEAVDTFLQATRYPEGMVRGTNSFLAFHNAAVILDCLGEKEEAALLYEKSAATRIPE